MWNKSGSNYHECGQAGRICVCKLCNCGYHKCPAKHTSVHTHYDNCTKLECGAKFPEWPMPKRFVRDHPAPANSNARLDCNTTYTDNFVKHPLVHSDTAYSVDYWDKSKNMQPRKKMAPQTHHGSGKFCGDTTYNVDFVDCGKGSPVVVVKHGCSLGSSGAKFNGDTTYHDDFRKWNIPKKYVHISRDSGTSGPFAGATTYQTDFKGQPIAQNCPILAHGKPTFICGDHMCY
ncbi:hypothetical protein CY35_10G018000 [Sphagnum magellanicum]|nr:hypothetical protein CY35_10G018000 [Sphagnum magellanicum]